MLSATCERATHNKEIYHELIFPSLLKVRDRKRQDNILENAQKVSSEEEPTIIGKSIFKRCLQRSLQAQANKK